MQISRWFKVSHFLEMITLRENKGFFSSFLTFLKHSCQSLIFPCCCCLFIHELVIRTAFLMKIHKNDKKNLQSQQQTRFSLLLLIRQQQFYLWNTFLSNVLSNCFVFTIYNESFFSTQKDVVFANTISRCFGKKESLKNTWKVSKTCLLVSTL